MDTISHSCLRAAQYQNSFSREHFSLSLFVRHVYETSNWRKSTLTQQDRLFIFQYQNSFYWKHLFSICSTRLWNLKLVKVNKTKYLYFRVSRNYSISPALDRYWTSFDKCHNFFSQPWDGLILSSKEQKPPFFTFSSAICEFVQRICFLAGMNPWGTISMLQRPW